MKDNYKIPIVNKLFDEYLIPIINELFNELIGATYFLKLDLSDRCHQIRMEEIDIPKMHSIYMTCIMSS